MAVMAIGANAQSNVIQSLQITTSVNGQEQVQDIPASGMPEVDLTDEPTTSLIIKKIVVTTSSANALSSLEFVATMYTSTDGTPASEDEWRRMPLQQPNPSQATWVLDMGEGIDLVDGIDGDKIKTFEFYLQGKTPSSADAFYNNGGADYKIKFTKGGEGEASVKFYKEGTARIGLKIDGEDWETSYTGDFIREKYYGWNPDEISSLEISSFYVTFSYNDGVGINGARLLYKVYEEGSDADWKSLEGTMTSNYDTWDEKEQISHHKMAYSAEKLACDVTSGLSENTNYILEIKYQVETADGKYYYISKGMKDDKFAFSLKKGAGISLTSSKQALIPSVRFNLSGQPVGNDFKGIVIENNRKIIVE